MENLLPLIDDNREIALESESQNVKEFECKLDHAIARGKIIMQSRLSSVIGSALPNIDSFVDTVDNIVRVRQDKATIICTTLITFRPTLFSMLAGSLFPSRTR